MTNEELSSKTRKALREAVKRLFPRKDIDEMAISEIAGEAGVSRMAFYRNYASLEALYADCASEMLEKLASFISDGTKSNDKRLWYETVFLNTGKNVWESRMLIELIKRYIPYDRLISILFPDEYSGDRYGTVARAGGFLAIISEWLYFGMKESPADMAVLCTEMLDNNNA